MGFKFQVSFTWVMLPCWEVDPIHLARDPAPAKRLVLEIVYACFKSGKGSNFKTVVLHLARLGFCCFSNMSHCRQ